jgi:hypothetical protein
VRDLFAVWPSVAYEAATPGKRWLVHARNISGPLVKNPRTDFTAIFSLHIAGEEPVKGVPPV